MKTLFRVLGAIVVCLILLLVVLRFTGFEPHGRTPGLWLKGDVVATPVADWSFTDKVPNIKLQTQSPYLLPHSVTIDCVAYNGQLYLTSTYPAGTHRSWDDNVLRDPQVRIKVGDQLYDRMLVSVTDPAERQAVLNAKKKKYPELKTPANANVQVFHVAG